MINRERYIDFIVNLHGNTSLKQALKKIDSSIDKNNFLSKIKNINISNITNYSSGFTIYDLLFGDLKTIQLIDDEFHKETTIIKNKSNKNIRVFRNGINKNKKINDKYKVFLKQYGGIRKQNETVNKILIESIEVKSCSYCQTQIVYSFETKHKEMSTAQFDHFIPTSKNELLAMSYSNLIPSCEFCNSRLKGATTFNNISTFFTSLYFFNSCTLDNSQLNTSNNSTLDNVNTCLFIIFIPFIKDFLFHLLF